MRAQGVFAVGFGEVQPDAGFEPLPVFADEADQGDGRGKNIAGQGRDFVEHRLRRRIHQPVGLEGLQAFGFIGRQGNAHGAPCPDRKDCLPPFCIRPFLPSRVKNRNMAKPRGRKVWLYE